MTENELEQFELEQVALLPQNPAYKIVIEALEAEVDWVSTALEACKSPKISQQILNQWRVLRRVTHILKNAPQSVALELENMRPVLTEPMGPTEYMKKTREYAQAIVEAERQMALSEASNAVE